MPESRVEATAMVADARRDDLGIARAREILGSLQVRREELLNTVRESRANRTTRTTNASEDTDTPRHAMALNRPKTAVFDGTETQLLTAQMSKVLQERRDRLSRILAGLDPDGGNDECRETSPVESDASRSVDLGSLKAPGGWSFAASPGDAKSPFRKRLDSDHSSVFTSQPPTLEEIREAFNTNTTEESTSHETVVASHDFTAEDDETSIGSTGLTAEQDAGPETIPNTPSEKVEQHQQLSNRSDMDGDHDDMLDESNEIASPTSARSSETVDSATHTPSSNASSIRRAYSFEDTLVSARDEPSIRATLSFNSSFLDSASRLKFKPRSLNLHRVATPPPIQSHNIESGTTKTPIMCFTSLQEPGASVTEEKNSLPPFRHDCAIQQSGSGCSDPNVSTQLKSFPPDDATKCNSPINFFPPDAANTETEPTSSQSPVSTSSTLTSREDRAHYLRALCDSSAVKRPVPRYPVADGSLAYLDEEKRVNDMECTNGIKRSNLLADKGDVENAAERRIRGSSCDDLSPSNSFIDDRSQLISEASSFDGTYDDTMTSGYLSFGTLERRSNTIYGDDWTETSILMPNKSIESLEDGDDSIDRLLPPPAQSTPVPSNPINKCQKGITHDSDATKLASCLHKTTTTTSRKHPKPVAPKKVVFAPASTGHQNVSPLSRKKPAFYFVEEEVADAQCHANGGLYAIALATGLNLESPPMNMLRIKPCHGMGNRNMRLNPDFRCGARGSLYDLCVQSGFDLTKPWDWRKKRPYMAVKGGLFDLALRSGLTMELLHSRGPLTIKTKPLSLCRQEENENAEIVLPEDVSDYECGANGNLFLAFESAGGDYVSKGSLYYLATQSGMKLGQ